MNARQQLNSASVSTDGNASWTVETTASFCTQLDEMAGVLNILISSVSEYSKDDGRSTDEAFVLANELLLFTCSDLERQSYEYTISREVKVGDLSLCLMLARSILEIIDGMFHADGWKIKVTDKTLAGYLGAVKRQVDRAYHEASTMQFKEVA